MKGLMQHQPLVVNNFLEYAARWHGQQEIVSASVEGGIHRSNYSELHTRSQQCALALQALGVRNGDIVATLAWNTQRHLECWYGIMGLSAVCHTLNPRLFAKDLKYIIGHAGDKYILADISFVKVLEGIQDDMASVRGIIFLTDEAHMPKTTLRNVMCYETLLASAASQLPFTWLCTDEDAACGLCYTSGTTGNPKGVLYSHRSNYLHAMLSLFPDNLGLSAADSVLMVVPMFHANAWGLAFAPLIAGAKLVLPGPNLDGKCIYGLLEDEKVTLSAGVPTVWQGLIDHMQTYKLRLSHVRKLVVGGAAAPKAMITTLEKEFKVTVQHLWGMTETSPIGTISGPTVSMGKLTWEQELELKSKQGRPHIFLDMRVVDDNGKVVPHDGKTFGDLEVRGPIAMRQYFKADRPAVDSNGWFPTGDVSIIDEHGCMKIVDRSKDVLKSGGEWISSIEVENAASGHPSVAIAAVIGIPHPKWSERPLLVIQCRPGMTSPSKDEMLQFLEGKIASWWMPDHLVTVAAIPLTATGKISKKDLREQLKDVITIKAKL